jgi:hypothetical protein
MTLRSMLLGARTRIHTDLKTSWRKPMSHAKLSRPIAEDKLRRGHRATVLVLRTELLQCRCLKQSANEHQTLTVPEKERSTVQRDAKFRLATR